MGRNERPVANGSVALGESEETPAGESIESGSATEVDDAAVDAIADPQRRWVARYLRGRDVATPIDAVTEVVAAADAGLDRSEVGPERRRHAAVKLHHVHVPKLEDAGVLDHDEIDGTVSLTEKGERALRRSA